MWVVAGAVVSVLGTGSALAAAPTLAAAPGLAAPPMLGAAPTLAAAPRLGAAPRRKPPPPGRGCPTSDAIKQVLGATVGSWKTACAALGSGQHALVAGRSEGSRIELRISIRHGDAPGDPRQVLLAASELRELRPVLAAAEDFEVEAALLPSAKGAPEAGRGKPAPVLRVSWWGLGGEGQRRRDEVVVLLRDVVGRAPAVLWTGLGSRVDTQFGACAIVTTARFALLPDGHMERQLTSKARLTATDVTAEMARDLATLCEAPPPRRDVFAPVPEQAGK